MWHLSWWLEPLSRSLSHHFGPVCWRFTRQVGIHHFCSRSSLIPTVLPCYRLSLDYMLARRVSHYIPLGCCSFIRLGSIANQCMLSHFFLIIWFFTEASSSHQIRTVFNWLKKKLGPTTFMHVVLVRPRQVMWLDQEAVPNHYYAHHFHCHCRLHLRWSHHRCAEHNLYYYHHSLSLRLHQNFLVLQ